MGMVIVLDNLKSVIPLLDMSAQRDWGQIARAWASAGGTMIALSHTNKHKDKATDKHIYKGTSDVRDDPDELFIGNPVSDENGLITVEFDSRPPWGKQRGAVEDVITFQFKKVRGQSYEDLMDSANIYEYEKVQVLNITNGNRLDTYAIKGKRGSGCIKINGAAAHHMHVNDLIIIVSYCQLHNHEFDNHKPKIVHVDSSNDIVSLTSNEMNI